MLGFRNVKKNLVKFPAVDIHKNVDCIVLFPPSGRPGSGMTGMRSKIQVQVLALYKECLRSAERKQPGFKTYIRNEFKKNGKNIPRTDTMRIEYMMRSGRRKLSTMNDPNVTNMGQFVE